MGIMLDIVILLVFALSTLATTPEEIKQTLLTGIKKSIENGVSEMDIINMISNYEVINPEITERPKELPFPLATPLKVQQYFVEQKDHYIHQNLPRRSVPELQEELRLMAGETLSVAKQALELAYTETEDAKGLQKKLNAIKTQVKTIGSTQLSKEQVDHLIEVHKSKIAEISQHVINIVALYQPTSKVMQVAIPVARQALKAYKSGNNKNQNTAQSTPTTPKTATPEKKLEIED